jgi:hypothetical protein
MQTHAGTIVEHDETAMPEGSPGGRATTPATDPICLDQTSRILEEHGLATPDELRQLRAHGLAPLQGPRPWDPLEFLAALRVRDPDARPVEVERLGRSLSQAIGQQLALVPFASRMPTPSGFYDVNKEILKECRRLMTPVLYAEEAEVIGIGSINPVALRLTSEHIMHILSERTGSRPIVSRMILHHDGWISLCQKQFGI